MKSNHLDMIHQLIAVRSDTINEAQKWPQVLLTGLWLSAVFEERDVL